MTDQQFEILWIDGKREPRAKPDPRFPNGIDAVLAATGATCKTPLPYPAPRCGYYMVRCLACRRTMIITTAGRADDPRSITMQCKRGTEQ